MFVTNKKQPSRRFFKINIDFKGLTAAPLDAQIEIK